MRIIQKASIRDAKRLADLAERTFRDTFEADNSRANMDAHCSKSYSQDIQAEEIADPGMITLLSKDADELVGYAQLRWGHAPTCVMAEAPGEIQRLYVSKAWQGAGIAHDLMQACIAEMIRRQIDVVWLGVWERNPRAIAFYRKCGFTEVGEHIFTLGADRQRDVVMARSCRP
ncbi:Protease synthase and sporulation negative regulatory protein PAI 1 [Lacunisphaera limnophila]|uniref:Protease synthase and sporulation negative regulatory protein PAI 1 n=1 Tax=Lacunisphaera limnophila TaxID=1838286 RepID=A0A1D8AW92_9BACT|nr:GNAT family N-acetyltransferase [Lacunisphaera limnophila]AOS45151.1 Protease synthase and sporulation negative regulatory protein PAI 1 [Lacunisphaera limnophila]